MTNFIIPNLYKNFPEDIFSLNLVSLLNHQEPLVFLRALYKEDIKRFYAVRDELILRGISLEKKYQNNFFPNIEVEYSSKIVVESNKDLYKKIDFSLLGLPDFVSRFNVQSDLFFNSLPIEGFTLLAKNNSVQFLINFFNESGFTIIDPFLKNNENKNLSFANKDKIEDVYCGSEFSSFRQYCLKRNFNYVSDLSLIKINDFINEKYVGVEKVRKSLEKYTSYIAEQNPINKDLQFFVTNDFRAMCERLDINYLEMIDFFLENSTLEDPNSNCYDFFESHLNKTIELKIQQKKSDLIKKFEISPYYNQFSVMTIRALRTLLSKKNKSLIYTNINDDEILLDILNNPYLEKESFSILNQLIEFQLNLKTVDQTIKKIKENLTERNLEILLLRSDPKHTLESIGNHYLVTRERARQIIKKAQSKVNQIVIESDFDLIFEIYSNELWGINFEKISGYFNVFDLKDQEILKVILSVSYNIEYFEYLGIYTSKQNFDFLTSLIKNLDTSSTIVNVLEALSCFNFEDNTSGLRIIELESLDFLMSSYKYYRHGNDYIKETLNLSEKIGYVFKTQLTSPIKMDEKGFEYLNKLLVKIFGEGFLSNKRSATEAVRRTENIILVDRLTFQYHDPYVVSIEFLNFIEEYLGNLFLEREWINVEEVFRRNLDLMNSNGIRSKIHLYSIIKYYLNDNYDIGKGNTLNIYRTNTMKMKSEEVLENILIKNNSIMKKGKALEVLNWAEYKLDQLIGNSSKFLRIENDEFLLMSSLNVTDADKEVIITKVKGRMREGFVFSYDIFLDMQFDEHLNELLVLFKISNHTILLNLIKNLLPNIRGHSNFMYIDSSPIDTLGKFLIKKFPMYTSRKEIINFLVEKGYSFQTADSTIRELLESRSFIESERNTLINRKAIKFDNEMQESLSNYLEIEFNNEEYLSLSRLIGYRLKLPLLEKGNWTHHIIYNLAIELGYKPIRTTNDYRYEKLVLVKPTSKINSYNELIYFILKYKYKGPLHESAVADYLAGAGFSHNKHKIYSELKNSSFFDFNELGWISLKGGEKSGIE